MAKRDALQEQANEAGRRLLLALLSRFTLVELEDAAAYAEMIRVRARERRAPRWPGVLREVRAELRAAKSQRATWAWEPAANDGHGSSTSNAVDPNRRVAAMLATMLDESRARTPLLLALDLDGFPPHDLDEPSLNPRRIAHELRRQIAERRIDPAYRLTAELVMVLRTFEGIARDWCQLRLPFAA